MRFIRAKTRETNSYVVYINVNSIDSVEEMGDYAIIKLNGGSSRRYETIESAETVMRLIEMACSEFETKPAVRRENQEEPTERNE